MLNSNKNKLSGRWFFLLGMLVGSCFCLQSSVSARESPIDSETIANLPSLPSAETPGVISSQVNYGISIHDYLLGAGDQLSIEVIGYSEFDDTHMILPDGTISLPYLGYIQ